MLRGEADLHCDLTDSNTMVIEMTDNITWHAGCVKFYDPIKNHFGFVIDDLGGPDVYVHENTLGKAGITDLSPGQRVKFVVAEDRIGRRPRAVEIEIEPATAPEETS